MTASIFKNSFHNATVMDSQSTAYLADGSPLNMLSGTTYDKWKPDDITGFAYCTFDLGQQKKMDYFAYTAHNLNEQAMLYVALAGSNSATFTTEEELGRVLYSATEEPTVLFQFTSSTDYRYYRFKIASPNPWVTQPEIGVFYIGNKLDLPEGIRASYTPPDYGINSNVSNNNSGSNHFIGRSIKRSNYEFVVKNDNLPPSWFTANWNDLYDYIEQKPFFYLWNDLFPDSVVFGWSVNKIAAPKYTNNCFMSFSFKCEGFRQ